MQIVNIAETPLKNEQIETAEKPGFSVIPAKAGIQKFLILKNTGFPDQVGE